MNETVLSNYAERENPKMLDIYVKQAWHSVFCYGLVYQEEFSRYGSNRKLMMAIVSGADSALQSVKSCIDLGSNGGIRFGHGEKTDTDYEFVNEFSLTSEKGAYEKFPMSLSRSRKGLIIAHRELLDSSKYLLSFEKNPADDVAKLLNGAPFGLWIEDDWKEVIFKELQIRGHLVPVDFYKDPLLFNEESQIHLFKVELTEEQGDEIVKGLLKNGAIRFPKHGDGQALAEVAALVSLT